MRKPPTRKRRLPARCLCPMADSMQDRFSPRLSSRKPSFARRTRPELSKHAPDARSTEQSGVRRTHSAGIRLIDSNRWPQPPGPYRPRIAQSAVSAAPCTRRSTARTSRVAALSNLGDHQTFDPFARLWTSHRTASRPWASTLGRPRERAPDTSGAENEVGSSCPTTANAARSVMLRSIMGFPQI